MSEDHARREVRRAVEAQGGRGEFAERAGIDPGTLGDFLDGKRWAHARTRTRIELALGWPPGRIVDLRDGFTLGPDTRAATRQIQDMIDAHPGLHPVAKAHLKKQIEFLEIVPADAPVGPHTQLEDEDMEDVRDATSLAKLSDVSDSLAEPPPDKGRRRRK